jgi:hypothetical protein
MTLVEAALRRACRERDLDLLNFGIGGTDVHDYRVLATLAGPVYEPDLALINFYAGNDAPDVYRHAHERSWRREWLGRSRLWTLGRSVLRLRRGVHTEALDRVAPDGPPPPTRPRGGTPVDPGRPLVEDHPALVGPTFTEDAFAAILAEELRRLYRPRDPAVLERAWRPVLAELDAIRTEVARQGRALVLAIYPSALQIDPRLRDALVVRLRGRARYAPLTAEAIDPRLPNARLAEYCRRVGLPCFDLTPALVEARTASPAPLYKLRDTHWTIRGNHVAAAAQAGHLAGLVCPGAARAGQGGSGGAPPPAHPTAPSRGDASTRWAHGLSQSYTASTVQAPVARSRARR